MSFFGDTNYDNQQQSKTFKPFYSLKKDQQNIYRIAPACRSLLELPRKPYAVFKRVHFGYSVPDSMNADKMRHKPFECIEEVDFKTKMVLKACGECGLIKKTTLEKEDIEAELRKAEHPEDYIKQATMPQIQWLEAHNRDSKFYCYAKNLEGEWNILKFGSRVKQQLDELMKRLYQNDGIKALDPSTGVWFKFTPNGLRGAKAFTAVEVLKEKTTMNGTKVEVTKEAPLSEADIKAIEVLPDIMTTVPKLTAEQIQALVDSGGAPEVTTRIFSLGTKTEPKVVETPVLVPQLLHGPVNANIQNQQVQQQSTPVPGLPTSREDFLKMFGNKS